MATLQLYEILPQPRTLSRDSDYTSPPMAKNFSAEDNQQVCLMCRDAVIKTMSHIQNAKNGYFTAV
jgi:hypothetical protein